MSNLAETRKQQLQTSRRVRAEREAAKAEKFKTEYEKLHAEFPVEVDTVINGVVGLAELVAVEGKNSFTVNIAVKGSTSYRGLIWAFDHNPVVAALVSKWKRITDIAQLALEDAGYRIYFYNEEYKGPYDFRLGGHPDLAVLGESENIITWRVQLL
jgi:hypothetical protein